MDTPFIVSNDLLLDSRMHSVRAQIWIVNLSSILLLRFMRYENCLEWTSMIEVEVPTQTLKIRRSALCVYPTTSVLSLVTRTVVISWYKVVAVMCLLYND